MALAGVSVARSKPCVDAAETVRAVLESADVDGGGPLADALKLATSGSDAFAVAPSALAQAAGFLPGGAVAGDRVVVSADTVDGVLPVLAKAGYVRTRGVWSETASDAYLNTGRELVAVQVLRPFALVAVAHRGRSDTRRGDPADRREITDHSRPVEPGWYLVGTVDDFGVSRLVGVTRVDVDEWEDLGAVAERLTCWAVEVEGFGASRCSAGCDTCDGRWRAERGSRHLTGGDDHNSAAGDWNVDNAVDFDESDTVACPACQSGRVGFLIY